MSAQLALYIAALRDILEGHIESTQKMYEEIVGLSSQIDFLDKKVHELTIKVAELERKNN